MSWWRGVRSEAAPNLMGDAKPEEATYDIIARTAQKR